MKAIILAGGYGTRLRPLTNNLPKPMVPIIDKPILEYIVEHLIGHGIKDIIITLGYKPESIVSHFGDGEKWGANIEYVIEETPLGTEGAVKNVEERIDSRCLVMSGDTFTNVNISNMLKFHLKSGGLVTMSVKKVDNPYGFGLVKTNDDGLVTEFVEKPENPDGNVVNMGIYILEKEVFSYIPKDTKYDFSKDLFPRIMGDMYAHFSDCYWSDIGTLSSYYLTNNDVALSPDYFGVRLS